MAHLTSSTYVAVLAITYLCIVRILRYRRCSQLAGRYEGTAGRPLASMTLDEAFVIQRDLAELEFPRIFSVSIFFALFKTYGVPSISSLLASTRELSNGATASKRAADTGILLTEMVLNAPDSGRAIDGIARINFLHGPYRKSGKITDQDMLYTLSLFALEPIRWVARYDWRTLTAVEKCALGVYWKEIGEAMEIPFGLLEPMIGDGVSDGLAWLEALDCWSVKYEKSHMRPAETNEKVSRATLDVALFNVPTKLRTFALGVVSALLEPRLREAMRFQEPKKIHSFLLSTVFTVRKLAVRHLCLPRPSWMRVRWFTDAPDPKTGNYHALWYVSHPWYVKPTFDSRWGLVALCLRVLGGLLPGDPGPEYHPEGYQIAELGPVGVRGKGETDMAKTRAGLRERRLAGGCPF